MALHLRRAAPTRQVEPTRRRRPRGASYERLVVVLSPSPASGRAVRIACELAADRDARITAVAVIQVPLDVPLETPDRAAETAARESIKTAHAIGATYGVSLEGVVLHTRDAGEAIVGEARECDAQVVVLAAEWPQGRGRARRLNRITDHVLKHSPCRVMLIGGPVAEAGASASDPVFHSGRPSDYWPVGEFVGPER